MKWVIKYKDGDQIHNYRHERYNDVGEWLGNGEIMFFDTEQKAKDYLSTLDSREYYRWIEKKSIKVSRKTNVILSDEK
tara:strand:+ start:38 stop:271 length:234 start_codon:yes stop_codon:yes gene_type:complete